MKNLIVNIIKILLILIIVCWIVLFISDYFRAKDGVKPFVCLNETIVNKDTGDYYRCDSFGYKYFEYFDKTTNQKTYGFGASFIKNDIEKEIDAK